MTPITPYEVETYLREIAATSNYAPASDDPRDTIQFIKDLLPWASPSTSAKAVETR